MNAQNSVAKTYCYNYEWQEEVKRGGICKTDSLLGCLHLFVKMQGSLRSAGGLRRGYGLARDRALPTDGSDNVGILLH
eukprot:7943110-Pyramimonas_sp.AAC.2